MIEPVMFTILDRYIDNLFSPEDEVLTAARKEARKAGLPEIQVSAGQGKFTCSRRWRVLDKSSKSVH
jgi:hypothetical protein